MSAPLDIMTRPKTIGLLLLLDLVAMGAYVATALTTPLDSPPLTPRTSPWFLALVAPALLLFLIPMFGVFGVIVGRRGQIMASALAATLALTSTFALGHTLFALTPLPEVEASSQRDLDAGFPSPPPKILALREDRSSSDMLAITREHAVWRLAASGDASWEEIALTLPKDFLDVVSHEGELHVLTPDFQITTFDMRGAQVAREDLSSLLLSYQCERLTSGPEASYPDFPCERPDLERQLDNYRRGDAPTYGQPEVWRTLSLRMVRQSLCGFEELGLGILRVRIEQSSIRTHYCPEGPGQDTISVTWRPEERAWRVSSSRGNAIERRFRQPLRAGEGACTLEFDVRDGRDTYGKNLKVYSREKKKEFFRMRAHGPLLWLPEQGAIDLGGTTPDAKMIFHDIDTRCEPIASFPILLDDGPLPIDPSPNKGATPEEDRRMRRAILFRGEGEGTIELVAARRAGGVMRASVPTRARAERLSGWEKRAASARRALSSRRTLRRIAYLRDALFTIHAIGWILLLILSIRRRTEG